MPARVNTEGDIGTALPVSDAYDVDNIFLTDEGWVYRHYKNDALTKFWDEIIVAGEVDPAATIGTVPNAPVDAVGDASPTFEVGDGNKDVENSPNFSGGGGGGPTPPATGPAASVAVASAGSGYSDATGVSCTGGNGNGLKVDITVSGDAIDAATIAVAGSGYQQGDTVQVAGGSGGTLTVTI